MCPVGVVVTGADAITTRLMAQDLGTPTSLFSLGPRREDHAVLPNTASAFQRLDQAGGPAADITRQTLEDWYLRLPEHARGPIARNFHDAALAVHLGAFWELYLHESALRLGFVVDVDIGREDPDRPRPDFLLTKEGCSLYVEATAVLGDDAVAPKQRKLVDQLYDAIERIRIRDFLLHVVPLRIGTSTPGRRTIGAQLENWLGELDADELLAARGQDLPRPENTFSFDGWVVRIKASAYLRELRGRADLRVIGEKTEGMELIGDVEGFKRMRDIDAASREIRKKAGKYGELDRPYIVAALCASPFINDHDIAQALIGRIRYRLPADGGETEGGYEPGGLWLGVEGLRNTRVSAVLTAAGLRPSGIAAVEPVLWTCPAPIHPLPHHGPFKAFGFDPEGAVQEHSATRRPAEILGLPHRWPIEDA